MEKILMRDTFVVSGIINQMSSLILLSTSFLTYAFIAFKISPSITIATSLFGLILFVVFRPFLNKIKKLSQNIRDTEKDVAHFINENIVGAKTIKTSGIEKKVISRGNAYFQKYKEDRLKAAFYANSIGSVFEPISFAFIAGLMLFFYRSPSFEIASFAVIIYLIQKIFSFIQTGQNTAQDIIANLPYVYSIARYKKDVTLNQEPKGGTKFEFKEKIEFNNLSFAYNKEKEVLTGINFAIHKGEMLGLIGPSGSGKTTIADLLMRLFSPGAGEINADGKNIAETDLRSWRKNIGYMPQDAFLLNDTIENNIKFYDESLTEEGVVEA
ncbi:MAG: ABC transporter ATP-binding protein, partial [Candidatus Nealsonbacteria bacterium]|nr:ABC transporter ATP-binding protein [Candidatus Nealsonbacteria bacterium]